MRDMQAIRRANLRLLIAQWFGPSSLARQLGYKSASYVSQMFKQRTMSEKTARMIEKKLDLPQMWMDQEQGERKAKAVSINLKLFFNVTDMVTTLSEEEKINLSKLKFREVVTMLYEEAVESGEVHEARVRRLLRIAK